MKLKIVLAVLLVALAALGVMLQQARKKAEDQRLKDQASILVLSTQLTNTESRLAEQQSVNTVLKTNLVQLAMEAEGLTNKLELTASALAKAEAEAKAAAAATAAATAEIARLEVKIKEKETENDALTKSMHEKATEINTLAGQIAETLRKLAQSEGDREFLLRELKRLQAEKAELERQFNDLSVLREQVRQLKEELSISRRLEWLRKGLYGVGQLKGGSLLQRGFGKSTTNEVPPGLDVELKTDGSIKVNEPTNAPPVPLADPPTAPPATPPAAPTPP